jgi:hypothetical protein
VHPGLPLFAAMTARQIVEPNLWVHLLALTLPALPVDALYRADTMAGRRTGMTISRRPMEPLVRAIRMYHRQDPHILER